MSWAETVQDADGAEPSVVQAVVPGASRCAVNIVKSNGTRQTGRR
jgi:hypothetical protein